MPTLAENKKAKFEYQILDTFEAGLMLLGHEVKSARLGRMSLLGAYVTIARGALWLIGAHIQRYPQAGPLPDYDPDRTRKLLLHTREIAKIAGKLEQKGLTLVPLSAYTKGSKIKLSFGLARGKKLYEKKETIKRRESDREIRRSLKG
ncbi:MAG TPA: SsrA-binding protein SmpB [Patescibacteria group bacterium]|nr:SsrA-binding protein SmpB [Patescibacteria group bacterium]